MIITLVNKFSSFASVHLSSVPVIFCLSSVFEGGIIPYPKRDFLTEEETEEKVDTANRAACEKVIFVLRFARYF